MKSPHWTSLSCIDNIILGCFDVILQRFHRCFHFQIVTPVSIEIGRQMSGMSLRKMARVSLKEGELGVALGNGRPLASIRVQILVKTTVNDNVRKPAFRRPSYSGCRPDTPSSLAAVAARWMGGKVSGRAGMLNFCRAGQLSGIRARMPIRARTAGQVWINLNRDAT